LRVKSAIDGLKTFNELIIVSLTAATTTQVTQNDKNKKIQVSFFVFAVFPLFYLPLNTFSCKFYEYTVKWVYEN
jgi:hypothetical protein